MRKLTEYPTLSLKERDRRWANVRAEMEKRGLDCLVLCGWPAMWDFNVANARYLCPIGGNAEHNVLIFPLSGEPTTFIYSPVFTEARNDLDSILDFVMDENVDLTQSALVGRKIDGSLVPLQSSSMSMVNEDIRINARSAGLSLVVVPLEFSNCIELSDEPSVASSSKPYLLRVNGLLTGVVFDRALNARLAFRTGPLHNASCRWRDYQDFLGMLPKNRATPP